MTERKPNLRTVRELTPSLQFRTIHGYRRAFRVAGSGPAILLIHGIGDNSTTWSTVQTKLAQRFTVIAPDLLGHGQSDKPRADYSVAAYANGMRDLLSVLDIDEVTVVGHSLGGGVAMQFAYQFPQLVERLILVGAGGVTKDVNVALRFASLPMGSEALALLRLPLVLPALQAVGRVAGALFGSTGLGRDLPDVLRILADLPEPTASSAFARTLRAVVDWRGQVVTMLDRCYLTQSVPVQLIWGSHDSVIPVSHARMAHAAMPGSQLEIFEGSGHFPFHDDPDRFVEVVEQFIDSTEPAVYDQDYLRGLLRAGISEGASPVRSTRGSRCSTRWAPTSAAPPDWRTPRSIGHMAIDVTVLRVFTDPDGNFGNPLGVVDASGRARRAPADRHPIGLQRNDIHRSAGARCEHGARAHLHPGHRVAVRGASDGGRFVVAARSRHPDSTRCRCRRASCRSRTRTTSPRSAPARSGRRSSRFTTWSPPTKLLAADPDDYPDDIEHYLWTWTDRERGAIRSRMFAANLGVPEDEATGAAAVRITDYLSRDLTIVQGKGSVIDTQWSPEGWVRIAGRVVSDGAKQID